MYFEFKYVAEMEKNGLKESDLPKDAKVGIKGIKDILKAIKMTEGRGKIVSQNAIDKVNTMDKWVYYEILDHIEGTNDNTEVKEEIKEVKEVIKEIKDDSKKEIERETPKVDTNDIGTKIDIELDKLFKSDKTTLTIAQIKSNAPKTYNAIFEEYSDGGENGVITSNYSLIETEEQVYTLKQA